MKKKKHEEEEMEAMRKKNIDLEAMERSKIMEVRERAEREEAAARMKLMHEQEGRRRGGK